MERAGVLRPPGPWRPHTGRREREPREGLGLWSVLGGRLQCEGQEGALWSPASRSSDTGVEWPWRPAPPVARGPEAQCRCLVSVEFIFIVTLFIEHGVCFYVLVLIQSCLFS